MAPVHWRWPRMRFRAGQFKFIPALALSIGNHANVGAFFNQYGALFDVGFKIGVQWTPHGLFSCVTDAFEFLPHGSALGIRSRQAVIEVIDSREHAGGHHCGRKTAALLIGPTDRFHRVACLDVLIIKSAYNLEPGQNTVNPVKTTPCRLGIKVTADRNRR